MTLTDFLLARIAEDEAAANDELAMPERPGVLAQSFRDAMWRVLAECKAKRAMIDLAFSHAAQLDAEHCCHTAEEIRTDGPSLTSGVHPCGAYLEAEEFMQPLAAIYADHPDFDPEWSLSSPGAR